MNPINIDKTLIIQSSEDNMPTIVSFSQYYCLKKQNKHLCFTKQDMTLQPCTHNPPIFDARMRVI